MPAPARVVRFLLGVVVVAVLTAGGTVACERHVEATRRDRIVAVGERVLARPAATPAARRAFDELLEKARERPFGDHMYRTLLHRCEAILSDDEVTPGEIDWLTTLLRDGLALSEHEFARRYHSAR